MPILALTCDAVANSFIQLYVSQIDKTILAYGILCVTKIALCCFPRVRLLTVVPEMPFQNVTLSMTSSQSHRGPWFYHCQTKHDSFHRFKCRVLIRS